MFNSHSSRRRLRAAVPSTSTPASSAADSAGLHPPQAKAPSRAASAAPCPVGSTPSPLRWTDMCPPDPHHLLQSSNPYQPGASPQVNDSKIFTSLERAPPSAPAHPFSLLTSHFPLLTSSPLLLPGLINHRSIGWRAPRSQAPLNVLRCWWFRRFDSGREVANSNWMPAAKVTGNPSSPERGWVP